MKNLLESGVHFGHQTKRWDPRMKKYIFAERNGIHIIDLQKTIVAIKEAYEAVRRTVLAGKSVLFVGTKKQAQQTVEREARRCGQHFVNNRWLGGMLTNFTTIKKSLMRLKKLEKMEVDGTFASLTKKEVAKFLKERAGLEKNLGGIKEMKELPGIVFIIDTRKEDIAAVVDTNCNPEGITYPIPGNDDAIRAINLFAQIIANAVIEAENEVGLEVVETLQEEKGDEGFAEVVEKGEFGADAKYDREEETVPVAAVVGAAAEEAATGFTDKDYSNYNPNKATPKEETATPPAEPEIDEDKLYKE